MKHFFPKVTLHVLVTLVLGFFLASCTEQQGFEVSPVLGAIDSGSEDSNDSPTPSPTPGPSPSPSPSPSPTPPASFYSWGATNNQNVYYSGHSLMDNPVPDFLVHLTSNNTRGHQWNQHNVIGSPMRVRVADGSQNGFAGWYGSGKSKSGSPIDLIAEVRNPATIGAGNKYNALILTERHDLMGVLLWENTIPFLRLFTDFYNQSNPTRVFWYHSWLDIDKSNPTPWINYETQVQKIWECAASRVNSVYESQSSEVRILNLPIGGALVDLVGKVLAGDIPGFTGTQTQRLNMLFIDNVHNTAAGQYYISMLNYIALYGTKPTNLAIPSGYDLSSINQTATLNALADHAWDYLNAYYNSGAKNHTLAQCRGFGPAFCTAQQAYDNGKAYNTCINEINYIFSSTEPTWRPLPN